MSDVRIQQVSKTFHSTEGIKSFTVFEQLDLSIQSGEFISLLGPSGCGKSTLLNIIAGLEKASAGVILLKDRVIQGPGTDRGFVFQEASLMPWKTALENVVFAIKDKKLSKSAKKERALHFLAMVQLTKFADSYPHELSGGMKQRVAIARALAMDPEVLLMDEPFGALDEQTRMLLHKELQNIWQQTRKTIIFVTHNIRESIMLSDRIALMGVQPGGIRKVYDVNIDRPRNPTAEEVRLLEADIMDLLGHELAKVGQEEAG